MKSLQNASFIPSSATLREAAAKTGDNGAVLLNAGSGVILMIAMVVPMHRAFTPALLILICLLFGPLLGFLVSSLYPRAEAAVGRLLGGSAHLDELYRLFAWSFLPIACATLLNSLILQALAPASTAAGIICLIPAVIIISLAARNYCGSIMAAQGFTRARGITCLLLSLLLFVVVLAAGTTAFGLLLKYALRDSLLLLQQI